MKEEILRITMEKSLKTSTKLKASGTKVQYNAALAMKWNLNQYIFPVSIKRGVVRIQYTRMASGYLLLQGIIQSNQQKNYQLSISHFFTPF